jgi:hypothetical protein
MTKVHTKDELAWALANVDEIVVEGDERLQQYAEGLITEGKPTIFVDDEVKSVEDADLGGRQKLVFDPNTGQLVVADSYSGDAVRVDSINADGFFGNNLGEEEFIKQKLEHHELELKKAKNQLQMIRAAKFGLINPYTIVAFSGGALLGMAVIFLSVLTWGQQSLSRDSASASSAIQPAWIIVALAAILAVYLLASKAIDADRNVEFAWKVTEKVSGRVVFKKSPHLGNASPTKETNRQQGRCTKVLNFAALDLT